MNRYLVLTAASLMSIAAFAEQPADPGKAMTQSFEALDKDSDRQLTPSEAKPDAGLARSFKAVDKNGDGYISRDEFETYRSKG
jgi:Ca2+-binding EF-hand superfamily protein